MKTIILATGNPNKTIELKKMLDDRYEVITMKDAGIDIDIIEDGETLEDNALIKVRAIKPLIKDSDVIVMGDDSGLSVDALDGAPGVYSARYAGEDVTYDDNNRKLLKEMANVTDDQRGAEFQCCIAMILPNGEEWTGTGSVRGTISHELRGENGFGYDPLFIAEETGLSFAEMTEEQKNSISHRARAIALVKEKLAITE